LLALPSSAALDLKAGAGSSPRRATHFSCLAKKSKQKKATSLSATRSCAAGNLRCSLQAGSAQTRLRLKHARPFFRLKLRSSARPEGIEHIRAMARTCGLGWLLVFNRPSEAKARATPLWLRRGAQRSRPHACRRTGVHRDLTCRSCLSAVNGVNAASSAAGRLREHRSLPRSFAAGSQTVGSPFFGYFLWRDKESDSPAGANSRLQAQARNSNDSKAQCPHPNPLPEGEGVKPPCA
jgi:hypothetical protein